MRIKITNDYKKSYDYTDLKKEKRKKKCVYLSPPYSENFM